MHFDVGVAAVDDGCSEFFAVVHNLYGLDPTIASRAVERTNTVLHRDEISAAEITGGAVSQAAGLIVRVNRHEARAPLAKHADRHQPHLALELALDLLDQAVARRRFCCSLLARQIAGRADALWLLLA